MSGSFLGRWSRRKRGLEAEGPDPASPAMQPAVPPAIAPAAAEPGAGPAPPAAPDFDPASLPPLESLDAGGDLTAFLHPRVPALLRQAALRRAWAADPGIRDFVGPADYAWDYNAPDGVPGFSFDLGNVDMKKLLAQMIGEPQDPPQEEPAAEAGPAAPDLPPEPSLSGLSLPEPPLPERPLTEPAVAEPLLAGSPPEPPAEAAPPLNPLRLSNRDPDPVEAVPPSAEPASPEPPPAARRRHGGALPRPG
jgi:hypothetical protein